MTTRSSCSDMSTDIIPKLSRMSTAESEDSLFNGSASSGRLSPLLETMSSPIKEPSPPANSAPLHWRTLSIFAENAEQPEFGSLDKEYGKSLSIRFYTTRGVASAEIGRFDEVPLEEVLSCLQQQKDFRRSLSLNIVLENCSLRENVQAYAKTLKDVLPLFRGNNERAEIERCSFFMDDVEFAVEFIDPLKDNLCRLFELNIGRSRNPNSGRCAPFTLDFELAADITFSVLQAWLETTGKTLRCLRIYEWLRLDAPLAVILQSCPHLCHLSISKIESVLETTEFLNIRSVEFDGQDVSYCDDDIKFAKKLVLMFPQATSIAFFRCTIDPVFEAFVGSRHVITSGASYTVFTPVHDLRAVTNFLRPVFKEIVQVAKEVDEHHISLPKYSELESRYGTRLRIVRRDQSYRTPVK